jgi:anti-anti-sigma factor
MRKRPRGCILDGVLDLSGRDDAATVIRVTGPADLRRLLAEVAVAGARHVIADLSGVATLDHEALALLVRARQEVRRHRGGHLCLAAPSRLILTVLHTMRLESAFPTFADDATARDWLETGAPAGLPAPLWFDAGS